MTPEENLRYTLIKCLEYENEIELSNIIKYSKVVYDRKWSYTGIVKGQRNMTINIKMPLKYKYIVCNNDEKISLLKRICSEIYEDDNEYAFTDLEVNVLADSIRKIEIDGIEKSIVDDSIYKKFMMELSNMDIDELEKKYLYEACECASRGNILAGTTMLGCSAEYLLIKMCKSYHTYLIRNNEEQDATQFKKKVIDARNACTRLYEFRKRFNPSIDILNKSGFSNLDLNLNFLDIIRTVRNESGHPTGNIISKEQLDTIFVNYQHFLKRAYKLISILYSDIKVD